MNTPLLPPWKRPGCLVWSPRTTVTGFVPLLGIEEETSAIPHSREIES